MNSVSGHPTPFAYSRGVGVTDTRPELRAVSNFAEFEASILSDVGEARQPGIPLADFKRTAPLPWFGAPMGGDGRRIAANAQPWPLLVLDVDAVQPEAGKEPRDLLKAFIAASRAIAPSFGYTSLSYTDDQPRCRLALHLSRPVNAPESKALAAVLRHHLADTLCVRVHGAMPGKADPPYLVVDSSMHAGSHIAFTPVDGFMRIGLFDGPEGASAMDGASLPATSTKLSAPKATLSNVRSEFGCEIPSRPFVRLDSPACGRFGRRAGSRRVIDPAHK